MRHLFCILKARGSHNPVATAEMLTSQGLTGYGEIIKHLSTLEDHGHQYMYYGTPYSDKCYVYGDDGEGNNLIVSYECNDLCRAIADEFEHDYEWLDILRDNHIKLEKVFDVDVETQDFGVIASLLLYLVASLILEDKFIDALNNGYLIRLIKRLEYLKLKE